MSETQATSQSIILPTKLDFSSAIRFAHDLKNLSSQNSIVVDFSRLGAVEPFPMLIATCAARQYRTVGGKFILKNADPHSYIAHMNFLAEFDEDFRTATEKPRENDRYIAIRALTKEELRSQANELNVPYIADAIVDFSTRLASLLTQEHSSPLVESLAYCLREIIRNAHEHSGADELLICAQYWPSRERVDLAVADQGIGIFKTLSRNKNVTLCSEMDALKVALLPGISGKPISKNYDENPWSNSGYGLFMTHRICQENGAFMICSGNAFIRLANNNKIEKAISPIGTIIGLTLHHNTLQNLNKHKLAEIAKSGSSIAKTLRGGNITASTASVNLRVGTEGA